LIVIGAASASGCGAPELEETATSAALHVDPNAFVGQHEVAGFACPAGEVMVGIHYNGYYVTCARLNGYRIASTIQDNNYATQVDQNGDYPSMHGCPAGYFLQSLNQYDGNFVCVSLADSSGRAVTYDGCYRDGPGAHDSGTQSGPEYGLSRPYGMHVCPHGNAMVGLHVTLNDLWCCS
jgi:hypothetical protein